MSAPDNLSQDGFHRTYRYGKTLPGQPIEACISSARPVPGSDCACDISVTGLPGGDWTQTVFGIDPLQATFLSMTALSARLYTSGRPGAPHVFWMQPGDDLGLPASDAIQDLVNARRGPKTL